MQPPQDPYSQPPQQQPQPPQSYPPQQYPQQQQQPYGQQPPYGYQQQAGYSREYRPAGGRYGMPGAQAIDYVFGALLLLISLGCLGFGAWMIAKVNDGAAQAYASLPDSQRNQVTLESVKIGIFVIGGIVLAWGLGLLFCSIGIFRFKKGGMIATGIMSLLALLFLGGSLAIGVSMTNGRVDVTSIVIVALALVYTVYGFARIGAAN